MTNPFSIEAINAPQAPSVDPTVAPLTTAPANDNPFAISNIQNDQAAQLRRTLRTAVQTKAENASEVARLQKRYPAPAEVLLRNLEEAKYIEAADIAGEKLVVAPVMAMG